MTDSGAMRSQTDMVCSSPFRKEGVQLTCLKTMSQRGIGPPTLSRTLSWICPMPQTRFPPPNADILHLLKLLRQQHRNEAELMVCLSFSFCTEPLSLMDC